MFIVDAGGRAPRDPVPRILLIDGHKTVPQQLIRGWATHNDSKLDNHMRYYVELINLTN